MSDLATNERLDELASAADTAGSGASFMSPESAPAPKRRGRPKGSKNKSSDEKSSGPEVLPPEGGTTSAAEQIEANKQFLAPVFQMMSQAGVRLAGDEKAAIGPDEMVIMVDSAARCVHQYLPNVVGAHTNLVVFGLTFANWGLRIYALREAKLAEIAELKKRRHAESQNQSPSANQTINDIVPPANLL